MADEIVKIDTGVDYNQGAAVERFENYIVVLRDGTSTLDTGDLSIIPEDL